MVTSTACSVAVNAQEPFLMSGPSNVARKKQAILNMYSQYLESLYGTQVPPYTHPTLAERYNRDAHEFEYMVDQLILAVRAEHPAK